MDKEPFRKSAGRPEAKIDWKLVDQMLQAGCDGVEIAGHFGIHPNTLYLRCEEEYKINFSEHSQEKKRSGKAILRLGQYKKALSGKGDSQMLKWLGIHILGQKETSMDEIQEATKKGAIDAIREIEEENRAGNRVASEPIMEDEQPLLHKELRGKENQIPDELGSEGTL